jgi:hypothetical protein
MTRNSGHLGEALMRALQAQRREAIGIDVLACSARRRPLSDRVSMQQKISSGRAARMR